MLVSNLSVEAFLNLPFRTLSDGGFVGLVFLIARSADDPELHRKFFRERSDIHDLTGRYLAVITPAPGASIGLNEEPFRTQYGAAVRDVAFLGDWDRLPDLARTSRWSVRMAQPRSAAHTVVAPT